MSIRELLRAGQPVREVDAGICSVLPMSDPGQPYDQKAAIYDALVGTRWYNRWLWGAERDAYTAFARAALESQAAGWHLDAGCGSLVVSAPAYGALTRPCLLVDASLGMLRRAQARLAGRPPSDAPLRLLQADLLTLPLREASVTSVLCMGMLHLFDEVQAGRLLRELRHAVAPGGALYLSSLVLGRGVGDRYLRLLHRAGEVRARRTPEAVGLLLERHAWRLSRQETTGNMSYLVATPVA